MLQTAPSRYHPLRVSLHWLVVLLIFVAFVLGKTMSGLPNDAAKIPLLAVHVRLGITTLLVMVVRLLARFRLPRPPHAGTGNPFLDWTGRLVHALLYALVFVMAISGLSLSVQSGLMPVLFGGSGAALPADFFAFTARRLHGLTASGLLLVIILHVGAALYHQFILKDGLLRRMGWGAEGRSRRPSYTRGGPDTEGA
ncbi:MAG: cytochrome b [Bacteroidota bacterium]